jgi:hypothetical protein
MRGRLGTGKHLDETYVLLPQAVPQTGGVRRPDIQPPGGLFGGGPAPAPGETPGGTQPEPQLGGLAPTGAGGGAPSIFDGATRLASYSSDATSALNLLGKIESWGITPGTQVQDMKLEVSALTGAQLEKLLRALPDGVTYQLRLNREEK